jgi:hypothetical protein
MQSKAATVAAYLAELPPERREAIAAIREVLLKNLPQGLEEGMQYGMIGYYVPHSVYPAGYHCDPKQPLPFACLASQKNYMSFYLMTLYGGGEQQAWFIDAWTRAGKKLDMGKCCVRFKRLEDVPLDVIGEAFRRVSIKSYIEHCESTQQDVKHDAKKTPSKKKVAKKLAPMKAKAAAPKAATKKPATTKRSKTAHTAEKKTTR